MIHMIMILMILIPNTQGMVYLPTWIVNFHGKLKGTCIIPIDPIGNATYIIVLVG